MNEGYNQPIVGFWPPAGINIFLIAYVYRQVLQND